MPTNPTPTEDETIWQLVATERRRLADDLDALTDAQWRTPSQCDAWSVEELASHVVTPFETSSPRFMLAMLRARGDFDRAIIALTARVHGRHTRQDAIRKLREHAENRWTPPKAGAGMMLAEIVVHAQDIRRVVGVDHDMPQETIRTALDAMEDVDVRADYARRIGVPVPTVG